MLIDPSVRLTDTDLATITKLVNTRIISFDAAIVSALLTEIEELKSELEGADQHLDALECTSGTLSMAEIKIAGLERRVDSLEDMFGTQQDETEALLLLVDRMKARLEAKDVIIDQITNALKEAA